MAKYSKRVLCETFSLERPHLRVLLVSRRVFKSVFLKRGTTLTTKIMSVNGLFAV